MFLDTKKTLESLNISHLHVFPYSEKNGTAAARMPQVPIEVRRKRAKELRELGKKIYLSELKKQTFKEHTVLVENDYGIGKTENNFNVKLENQAVGSIVKIIPSKIKNNFLMS